MNKLQRLIELNELMKTENLLSSPHYQEYTNLYDEIVQERFISKAPQHFQKETRFELPVGWFELFSKAFDELCSFAKEHNINFTFIQLKEKFGYLRIYLRYDLRFMVNEEIAKSFTEIAHKYESAAGKVCISCGEPGEMQTSGWYHPACKKHLPKRDNQEL